MIVNTDLNLREQRWLQMFLDVPYKCKQELQKQIERAKIEREYSDYYIFLRFLVPEDVSPIKSLDEVVPIEVIVSHFEGAESISPEVQCGGNSIPFIVGKNKFYPTSFMLHFSKGYVQKLEIYNLDSSALDIERIHIGKRNYRIAPSIWDYSKPTQVETAAALPSFHDIIEA